jgi:mRNA-degrading endonuclease RelE of RelBE toxin-antitoxin system
MPYNLNMLSFVETQLFTRLVADYLADDEYAALQQTIAANPELGPVIPGSGGVRKLRWAAPGRGKRGGYRVIYYVRRANGVIWMLTMYPKNVTENIPAHVLRQIRKEIEDG